MRDTAVVLVFTLCVGMYVCPSKCVAQECGKNPMKQVLSVAKRTGRTLNHVLTLLKDIDGPAYDSLAREFRLYAACVGLVDTGYFRKRAHAWPQVIYHLRKTEADVAAAPSEDIENDMTPPSADLRNYNSLLQHMKEMTTWTDPDTPSDGRQENRDDKRTGTYVEYVSKHR